LIPSPLTQIQLTRCDKLTVPFRVLLDRLARLRLQPLKSYAISDGTDAAERRLWEKRFVEIFNADLNEFVPRLAAEMEQETSVSP
jgi:hypothetical protein